MGMKITQNYMDEEVIKPIMKRFDELENLIKSNDKNVKLKIVDKDCYGEERTQLLNRTKISLDLPRVPWDFAPVRFLLSMSCCAMVVSEGNCPKEPYRKDVHYVQAADSDLTATILSYLRNEQQRHRITRDAYNYVKKENTLKKSVLDILQKSNLVDVSQLPFC